MSHAFRPAAHIEAENAQRKLERLRERWLATKDTWFDGSAESVERRIAHVDEVVALARSIGSRLYQAKAGSDALALLPQLRANRTELENMRDRIAGSWFPHDTPEGQSYLSTLPPGPDPRDYSSREEWMHARNLARYIEHAHDMNPEVGRDHPILSRDERLMSAAREFIENENTHDRQELLIRAQRHMSDRTWDWEPQAARKATRDFLGAVSDQIPVAPVVRQAAASERVIQDFDDSLMHIG